MSKLEELKQLEEAHYTKKGTCKFTTYFADPELADVNTILNAMPALLKVVKAAKHLLDHVNRDYSEWSEPLREALRELEGDK